MLSVPFTCFLLHSSLPCASVAGGVSRPRSPCTKARYNTGTPVLGSCSHMHTHTPFPLPPLSYGTRPIMLPCNATTNTKTGLLSLELVSTSSSLSSISLSRDSRRRWLQLAASVKISEGCSSHFIYSSSTTSKNKVPNFKNVHNTQHCCSVHVPKRMLIGATKTHCRTAIECRPYGTQ